MASEKKIRCLLVDDEPKSAEVIGKWIKAMGHVCDLAGCSESARKRFKGRAYDYAVVDVKLKVDNKDHDPDPGTGRALLQWIRKESLSLPVLMMTAHVKDPELSAELIQIGANGFFLKEVSTSHKFQQKIEAMLKGSPPAQLVSTNGSKAPLEGSCDLLVDENHPNVMHLDDKEIDLTKTEFKFMCFMAKYPQKNISTDRIIRGVWGDNPNGGPQDQRISSLKDGLHKKLKKCPRYKAKGIIQNVRGAGWKLDIPSSRVRFIPKADS